MKIKTRYIILCLTCVILLVAPGMLFALEPIAVKIPITMKGVYFSQTPPSAPLSAPLQQIPPAPPPLTAQMRNNAINAIRGAVGLHSLVPVQPAQPVVPPRVILTPWAPQSGQNYYNLKYGHNAPFDGYTEIYASGTNVTHGIYIRFKTIPGKLYMVDLNTRPFQNRVFIVRGVFSGSVNPVNDHIFIGFTATESTSKLDVHNSAGFYFWRCELTQVN